MKNLTKTFAVAFATTALLFSCEKSQNVEPTSIANITTTKPSVGLESPFEIESLKNVGNDNVIAVGCQVYSLVLAGNSGTPHIGGLDSYLVNVDMNTGNSVAASQIKIGVTPVKTVTGITKVPSAVPTIYGVTGINSNVPGRLLKINPATGATIIVGNTMIGNTQVFLQDIEHCTSNNRYYAIVEGTNRIAISVNGLTWVLLPNVIPTTYQLNGLTFRAAGGGVRMWVIAGAGTAFCSPNFGDMWELTLAGGLVSTNKYNATNALWTNKELGLDYNFSTIAACAPRNFVVGSAMGFLSNNMTLCPALPALIGAGQIKPTYDFAKQ